MRHPRGGCENSKKEATLKKSLRKAIKGERKYARRLNDPNTWMSSPRRRGSIHDQPSIKLLEKRTGSFIMNPLFSLRLLTCALFCTSPLLASPVEEEPHSPQTQVAPPAISQQAIGFEDLPQEIQRHIAQNLTMREQQILMECSKSIKKMIEKTFEGPYYEKEVRKIQKFPPSRYPEFQLFMRKAEKYRLFISVVIPGYATSKKEELDKLLSLKITEDEINTSRIMLDQAIDYQRKYLGQFKKKSGLYENTTGLMVLLEVGHNQSRTFLTPYYCP
ncbi:MAG: hypothetical protein ACK5O7_03930 [Holosporales bacterium]